MTDPQSIDPDSIVSLRPVTKDTLRDILRLKVTEAQEHFVANNAVSLAQAHFTPEAWYRAIYADETPVGFMMLYDDPAKPEYFLWRLHDRRPLPALRLRPSGHSATDRIMSKHVPASRNCSSATPRAKATRDRSTRAWASSIRARNWIMSWS